jgi:hypothetical protein
MFNIHTETPSGANSRGYDRETEEDALKAFDEVRAQLIAMKFVGSVVLEEDGIEQQREIFHVA